MSYLEIVLNSENLKNALFAIEICMSSYLKLFVVQCSY